MSQTETHDESEIQANCIFCKIVKGDIPAVKIYENEETLAFLDIRPNHRGHTLVIPKTHTENIYSTPAETLCHVALTVQKVAVAIKNALDADGVNTVTNNEAAAGQLVWHAHTHVIPRYNDDGGFIGKHYTYLSGEMEEIAEKIKKEI